MVPLFIIAGEVSGDMFAAELMNELKAQQDCSFVGCGGTNMRKSGLIPISKDNSLYSAVGLLEAGRFLLRQWRILRNIVPSIRQHHCKHVILVDHEVFSILAAKRIRKSFGNSVKIYFFIPPRVSMWGEKSASTVAELCDALFCYMEPDLPIYLQHNPNSFFFGNPLSCKLKTFISSNDFYKKHGLNPDKKYLALMPGSRKQEISKLLPSFLQVAKRLYDERNTEFLMTIAHEGLRKRIEKKIEALKLKDIVHLVNDSSLEIMNHCPVGIVSAGTITLESVMMGMYPVITYKVSNYTFNSIKTAEGLGDDTLIGLPNVFLQQRVFPELLQFEVTPNRIYKEVSYALDMDSKIFKSLMNHAKEKLSESLGSTQCIKMVAGYILEDIHKSKNIFQDMAPSKGYKK